MAASRFQPFATLPTRNGNDRFGSGYDNADDELKVGDWARDVIALAVPEQILCREDCAGLCPYCGKDLNVEPHEHVDRQLDPRWAALESLRDQL